MLTRVVSLAHNSLPNLTPLSFSEFPVALLSNQKKLEKAKKYLKNCLQ